LDVLVAILTLTTGFLYLFWLRQGDGNWSHPVIYSTVTALGLVTTYDLAKHFIFYEQLKTWWLYEHIYKMISAFSVLLSAFAGTVLPESFKPYSQIAPSIICIWLIIFFICQQQGRRRSLWMKEEAYSIKILIC
jgi:hypothetical protein